MEAVAIVLFTFLYNSFFGGSGCFVSLFRWFRSGVSVVSAVPFVSVVSFRWFRFGVSVPFVSVVSFRWFRFGVSGFSACRKNAGPKFGLRARHVLLFTKARLSHNFFCDSL